MALERLEAQEHAAILSDQLYPIQQPTLRTAQGRMNPRRVIAVKKAPADAYIGRQPGKVKKSFCGTFWDF